MNLSFTKDSRTQMQKLIRMGKWLIAAGLIALLIGVSPAEAAHDTTRRLGNSSFTDENSSAASYDGRWAVIVGADYFGLRLQIWDAEKASLSPMRSASGAQLIGETPSMSSDGRFVAFRSPLRWATNDRNGCSDIYLHDRDSDGNGIFDEPNGVSELLASADINGVSNRCSYDYPGDLYLYGLLDPPLLLYPPGVSLAGSGRFVAFHSLSPNLVASDTNLRWDVFVRDTATGSTVRASVSSSGTEGNGNSAIPSISADGRFVAFWSNATNLVDGDNNGQGDIFVRDVVEGSTVRWAQNANYPALSADGRELAFVKYEQSGNDCYVPYPPEPPQCDPHYSGQIHVVDLATGSDTLVSVNQQGIESDRNNWAPSISADGSRIAFWSDSANLAPEYFVNCAGSLNTYTVDCANIYVRDLNSRQTILASIPPDGQGAGVFTGIPALTGDGQHVFFDWFAGYDLHSERNGVFENDLPATCPNGDWNRGIASRHLENVGSEVGLPNEIPCTLSQSGL